MFLRRSQRTKDGKRHTYFALVESHRTKRGPRQRVVAQLGALTEDEQRRWQRTAVFHARHEDGRELPLFLHDDSREPIRDRPMSPAVALQLLHDVPIGDILLETVEGRKLRLRRVARPHGEQAEIIHALGLTLPERICADRDVTPREFVTMPSADTAPT